MSGAAHLMASLMYGARLRLLECAQLRIKDVDFERREIRIRDGKGRKDRLTPLPVVLIGDLKAHVQQVERLHQQDVRAGAGHVALPDALRRKYPGASRE